MKDVFHRLGSFNNYVNKNRGGGLVGKREMRLLPRWPSLLQIESIVYSWGFQVYFHAKFKFKIFFYLYVVQKMISL